LKVEVLLSLGEWIILAAKKVLAAYSANLLKDSSARPFSLISSLSTIKVDPPHSSRIMLP